MTAAAEMKVVHHSQLHTHKPRGNAVVGKPDFDNPTIVETYQLGNSKVHIASDCIRTDPDEIEEIIARYHAAGWAIVNACHERGEAV